VERCEIAIRENRKSRKHKQCFPVNLERAAPENRQHLIRNLGNKGSDRAGHPRRDGRQNAAECGTVVRGAAGRADLGIEMTHGKIEKVGDAAIAREVGEAGFEGLEDGAHTEDMLEERPNGGRLELEQGLVLGVVGLVEEAKQRFEAAPHGAR
jgi:hypothetical protein